MWPAASVSAGEPDKMVDRSLSLIADMGWLQLQ